MNYIQSWFKIPEYSLLADGSYDFWLVSLSVLIAILSSFIGLQVSEFAATSTNKIRRHVSLASGAIALGGGVWSMHFIGMLAFSLCTQIEYDWGITLASMFPSLLASWLALSILSQTRIQKKQLVIGGILVGAGIGTMHYLGMAAMQMAPLLRYDIGLFITSIVVAVGLAILALWIKFALLRYAEKKHSHLFTTLIASLVMGSAISGMHYTGMAAARFVLPEGLELSNQPDEMSLYLGIGIGSITLVMVSLVLAVNYTFRYRDLSRQANNNEYRIKAIMDTAIDGILTMDKNGQVLSANQATFHLFGWDESQLKGQSITQLLTPDIQDEFEFQLSTGINYFVGKSRDIKVRHKDGYLKDVRVAVGKVDFDGETLYVAIGSDLTERVKMETALRENESKFRSLITNIPGIAFRCIDQSGWPMIYISDAVESITGYPAADFQIPDVKRSFKELIHPEDLDNVMIYHEQGKSYTLEYRVITKSGEIRWLLEYGCQVADPNSKATCLDGFIMDITERKLMEEELRQAKETAEQAAAARAAFTANMSHEIRTPMNAIIGFSDILLETELSSEQSRHLTTINHSAKSLLHLLNDILDSAKLEKGKFELDIRDFDLIEEVDAVVSTLYMEAKKKGILLNTELSSNLASCYQGDPDRLRQILTNLIGNAIKFTPEGSVNLIVQPAKDNTIEFIVEDTGIGMSPQHVKNIFDAYAQADASISRKFGGTGLGTTISYKLAQLMNGNIKVESELNKGSQFTVSIPLDISDKCDISRSFEHNSTLPPLTILIVDDIQQNIDLLTLMLTRQGHQVLSARDGMQALIRMDKQPEIDLVLMDIQMPVMDGLTATQSRRESERQNNLKPIPIIALTASVMSNDKQAAKQAGMSGFANKPVDLEQLNREIAKVMNIQLIQNNDKTADKPGQLVSFSKGIKLWGNATTYLNELTHFIDEQTQQSASYYQLLADANWSQLKQLAHALKGVTGNLALHKFSENFNTLEKQIQKEQLEDIKSTLDLIFAQLKQIKTRVDKYIESHPELNQPDDLPTESLEPALSQLIEKVTHNEIDDRLLTQLSRAANSENRQKINQIINDINDFEFESALAELIKLQQTSQPEQ